MSKPIDMTELSFDAKAVAGGWFGLMMPGKGDLRFQMVDSRPSDRAQSALDELVRAEVISVDDLPLCDGLVYEPLVNCRPALSWRWEHESDPRIKFPLIELIEDEASAKAHQQAALAVREQIG